MKKKIAVIGSGYSGLTAAALLADQGHEVDVFEKNSTTGGRARVWHEQGFVFDMGPSWYWMPDVFEKFFAHFGKKPSDYYQLVKLDPGFRMVFNGSELDLPSDPAQTLALFESIEPGSALHLRSFLNDAAFKYNIGMLQMAYKPSLKWTEFANSRVLLNLHKFQLHKKFSRLVRSRFRDERLIALLEFPVLFLGTNAARIPALYSLMNHAAIMQGTFYPIGGMGMVTKAFESLCCERGVKFHVNSEVFHLHHHQRKITAVETAHNLHETNALIASADYRHVEQNLLPVFNRNYNDKYWEDRQMSPSCLIFFLGLNKKVDKLLHHTLFFDAPMEKHLAAIDGHPEWPEEPLFYVCCPSKTDPSVAPIGNENMFVLMPVAPDLHDEQQVREQYFEKIMNRLAKYCGEDLRPHIIVKRSYCVSDFKNDYHAFRGNAYGLANSLTQTAFMRPSMKNKNLDNLFYTGQLTVPGPGVPPALISGELGARLCHEYLQSTSHERTL